MLQWRYLHFKGLAQENTLELIETEIIPRISRLAPSQSADLDALLAEAKSKAEEFFTETATTRCWEHVPDDKKIRDWKYMSAVLFSGNNFNTDFGTDEEILDLANGKVRPRPAQKSPVQSKKSGLAALFNDFGLEAERRPMPPITETGGYSFIHALDFTVSFMEQEQLSQYQAASFLIELLEGKALYDALYLSEMLSHPERISWQRGNDLVVLAREINANYNLARNQENINQYNFTKINYEEEIARNFLRAKPKGLELPHKLGIHAVDGQLGWRAWRTYEEIPQRTISNLASIATYGLVAGGIAGWNVAPTTLMGTVDRADLCIMNYDTQHQGAVISSLEEYVSPGFKVKFTGSIAVMIDGRKEAGTDIIVEPSPEGILPSIPPERLIIVVPSSLESQIINRIYRFGNLLMRSPEEISATLTRSICYDPSLWGDFHHFNEWLQTTPQGIQLLEEKLGRPFSELKAIEEIELGN